jgi:CO/xanthine dehydrogenase FAD-binding subunit
MKPAPFEYERPRTLEEALSALAQYGGEAKVLAGGQSLVPLLNFRMLRPAVLIDINRLKELDFVQKGERGSLRIGALTRHHTLETSPLVKECFPVLAKAMTHVAHLAIRNRGTIGGSLTHADPAAELPMMALLLDAGIHARSSRGARVYKAQDYFLAPLTSALAENEIVTGIELPLLPAGTGWGFEEFSQRQGDFAIAAAAAVITVKEGKIGEVRLALMGVDRTPIRLRDIEAELKGKDFSAGIVKAAAAKASQSVEPGSDLKASAELRRRLVAVQTERVLNAAWQRALSKGQI